MLAHDHAGFAKGDDTVFEETDAAKAYVVVSADELQKEYERNEVAGDKKYLGKRLALRGTVAEIKRSIGQTYFVHLKGGSNQFMRPLAKMADGYVDFLADLQKGQSIQLLCEGGGMLMGSAVAAECVPADVWVAQMVSAKIVELPKSIGSDKVTAMLVATSLMAVDLLKETSTCFSSETKLGDSSCQATFPRCLRSQRLGKASRGVSCRRQRRRA